MITKILSWIATVFGQVPKFLTSSPQVTVRFLSVSYVIQINFEFDSVLSGHSAAFIRTIRQLPNSDEFSATQSANSIRKLAFVSFHGPPNAITFTSGEISMLGKLPTA